MLVAVASRDAASRNAEHTQTYARECRIERAFDSYAAMLDSPDADVIYNLPPNHLHAEWTIRTLRAGKHVLCEKPLTTCVEDADVASNFRVPAGGERRK